MPGLPENDVLPGVITMRAKTPAPNDPFVKAARQEAKVKPYEGPAGGWGSVGALGSILTQEEVAVLGSEILWKQNKPGGYMCVSCSWAKPAKPRPFDFCENGAKATAWEITSKTTTPDFFAAHTLTALQSWSDH